MVERSLSMREVPGSIPGFSIFFSFHQQVNKVGLKVRAALITEVYRKSLSINLTTMSTYSTGQVRVFPLD